MYGCGWVGKDMRFVVIGSETEEAVYSGAEVRYCVWWIVSLFGESRCDW